MSTAKKNIDYDALEENLVGGRSASLPAGRVIALNKALEDLHDCKPYRVRGRVTEVTGMARAS